MNKTLIASLTTLILLGSAFAASGTSTTGTSAASMSGMSMSGSNMNTSTMKMDVNTASLSALEKIPGMSAKLAQAVIAARPIKNQADLVKRVKGIGKKNVRKFAPYLTYGS